jgi:hypothetical protein
MREPGGSAFGGNDVEAARFAKAVAVDAEGVHDPDVDRSTFSRLRAATPASFNAAGRDTGEVGAGDHGHERLLGPAARCSSQSAK